MTEVSGKGRPTDIFARPWVFIRGVPDMKFLPPEGPPEIAFAGRSNVGKSSLINRLTNRTGLARTSNTPGRTQELNFFDVGEPLAIRLCDMPGYGFAEAPKDMVKRWRFLVNDYLRGRQVLKRAIVLVDSRRHQACRSRDHGHAGWRGRQLSAGSDQDRQDQGERA